MVGIAQLVERLIVAQEVTGSIPVAHPICRILTPLEVEAYHESCLLVSLKLWRSELANRPRDF